VRRIKDQNDTVMKSCDKIRVLGAGRVEWGNGRRKGWRKAGIGMLYFIFIFFFARWVPGKGGGVRCVEHRLNFVIDAA
jgi:hypothetical protein